MPRSGRPGPHVLINALTHGNELCAMVAATHLVMPPGLGSGTPLIQHGRHGVEGRDAGVALSPFLGCSLLDRVS